ncbi:unnamed protein product [Rotaria socialis]|uniref:Uncharacterized protein n=3 Tax=Rotaria socialis TaxID=392032 RepID=A0A818UJV5_9BILA|nr:unnamed protein product [Rotaria socialis]CAF4584670.1 unnamed protein product [Rotaria socialis]CAF4638038.1 unnamed protein product [Rotaria socialis]CAF4733497.1 unnamed protein product [Rotaria socialis]
MIKDIKSQVLFERKLNLWMILMCIVFFGKGSEARLPKIGVISFWDPGLYNQLPRKSLALINPANGIFTGQTRNLATNLNAYQNIVAQASKRRVRLLGYVPTGYFNHTCDSGTECQTLDRIDAQVKEYFRHFPKLSGIFFDEACPKRWICSAFTDEYHRLRSIVRKYNSKATIAFNVAVPDRCTIAGLKRGEIIVVFENSFDDYAKRADAIRTSTQAAHNVGAIVWCLIHSVSDIPLLQSTINTASNMNIDLFYATDIGGNWTYENTWGSPPTYWDKQVELLNPKRKG